MNSADDLLEAPQDRTQGLMNTAYKRWQPGGELEKSSQEDFYAKLEEPERMAVVFGNLNYQVENGGFSQWFGNGYGDSAMPHLWEYFEKYAASYPAIAKIKQILTQIHDAFEDDGGEDKYDSIGKWLEHDKASKLGELIGDEDWDGIDDLLGGTDLDRRTFNRACERKLSDIQIETYEKDGKWGYRTFFDTADGQRHVINDTGVAAYDSEEEADESGSDQEFDLDDLDSDVVDAIKDEVKNELEEEYAKHVNKDRDLDRYDTQFYSFNAELLQELEQLINKEYPNDLGHRALAALKKGWGAVKQAVQKTVAPVQKFAQRVGRAGQAAAKEFGRRESRTPEQVVANLLDG